MHRTTRLSRSTSPTLTITAKPRSPLKPASSASGSTRTRNAPWACGRRLFNSSRLAVIGRSPDWEAENSIEMLDHTRRPFDATPTETRSPRTTATAGTDDTSERTSGMTEQSETTRASQDQVDLASGMSEQSERRVVAWASVSMDGFTSGPGGPAQDQWLYEHAGQEQTSSYFEGIWNWNRQVLGVDLVRPPRPRPGEGLGRADPERPRPPRLARQRHLGWRAAQRRPDASTGLPTSMADPTLGPSHVVRLVRRRQVRRERGSRRPQTEGRSNR